MKGIKKFVCALSAILIIFTSAGSVQQKVFAYSQVYAKVDGAGVILYSLSDKSDENNILCFLEESYFVEIMLEYDANFYKVKYNGINGFVQKNMVVKVSGTPKRPYPSDIKIKTKDQLCTLRSSPKIEDNRIMDITAGTSNIRYIGKTYGVKAIDFSSDVWYLVEVSGSIGYIYNYYVSQMTAIYENLEDLTPLSKINENMINPLSNPMCMVVIGIILCPTAAILFVMFKKQSKEVKS